MKKITVSSFSAVHGILSQEMSLKNRRSNYIGKHDIVIITCPIHGDFTQRASDHLNGCGCYTCDCVMPIPKEEICLFLDSLDDDLHADYEVNNNTILDGILLDIVIPNLQRHSDVMNFAIDFCGKYWHSNDAILEKTNGRYDAEQFLALKEKKCKEKGYVLISFDEERWKDDKWLELKEFRKFIFDL